MYAYYTFFIFIENELMIHISPNYSLFKSIELNVEVQSSSKNTFIGKVFFS